MDSFLALNQTTIKRFIKGVERYDKTLQSLSSWWEKIALVGKINSFEVASTILEDMDSTLSQFHILQKRLIENLTNEHARKIIAQDVLRCQMAIDVLIRNLFERTADIGFLATDSNIIHFLSDIGNREKHLTFMTTQMRAYADIYSVYRDVILVTADQNLVFQLSQPERRGRLSESFIQQALDIPDQYVEYFGPTALIPDQQSYLLYAQAVFYEEKVVGVLVLCFRFKNELEGITNDLLFTEEKNPFLLANGAGDIIFAPQSTAKDCPRRVQLDKPLDIVSIQRKDSVQVVMKGQPYQGYAGPDNWHTVSLLALANMDQRDEDVSSKKEDQLDLGGLISPDLFDIRCKSIAINDDLELIVLNGIITAAREDAVEFVPVLEAIKQIGRDIDNVFETSISALFSTIISGQLNAIRLQASLAVNIMDRNLYERANDCRWWALNSALQTLLAGKEVNTNRIRHILGKIHSLYTVYHTLYVYDKNRHYVAFSDDHYADKLGQPIEVNSGGKEALECTDIYRYSVSEFMPFECCDGHYTYIYNAGILHPDMPDKVVGGIGIVFDSATEFTAILKDILPKENGVVKEGSQSLFTSLDGKVIASSSDYHQVGSFFRPDIDKSELVRHGTFATIATIENTAYIIGAATSSGYREYKRQDGYDNTIVAWVLVPC
ncbi:cache domain-containing protein [Marinomonas sp. A79]|uniref:Cache domain-containing protein n=1 Tax=Marinomonas vulgaris TaxID=2823372 RepID=A0ABS5HCZ6_9GAMM|nr:cache domain-containing protein [Marinomonas vulgaris]MBR7889531.1 cache domain-containing protein [Marinomonas vulgaris]